MNEILQQLNERFIPFWTNLCDERGGYFGGYKDGVANREAQKGALMHLEVLWFFSRAYQTLKDQKLKGYADHAYKFIIETMVDRGYGGLCYAVRSDGIAIDQTKHANVLARAIYAFVAYFDISRDYNALKLAYECFNGIEVRCRREIGYHEQFDCFFLPTKNSKMSDGDAPRHVKTMLNILEAYVDLYVRTRDEKVRDALNYVYELLKYQVFDESVGAFEVYLDDELSSDFDVFDVGVNMEGSWAMTNAALALGTLTREDVSIIKKLAETSLSVGWDSNAFIHRKYGKKADTDRFSWVQAESMIALLNAYNVTKDESHYERANILWEYIKNELAVVGGWYYGKTKEGKLLDKPIVAVDYGPLRAGRMFLEILRRGIKIGL